MKQQDPVEPVYLIILQTNKCFTLVNKYKKSTINAPIFLIFRSSWELSFITITILLHIILPSRHMQVPPAGFVKQNTRETENRYPSNIANIKSNWWNNRAYLRYMLILNPGTGTHLIPKRDAVKRIKTIHS